MTVLNPVRLSAAALGYIDLVKDFGADPSGGTGGQAAILQSAWDQLVTAGISGTVYLDGCPVGSPGYKWDDAQQSGGSGGGAYSGQALLPNNPVTAGPISIKITGPVPANQIVFGPQGGLPIPVEAPGGVILNSTAVSGNAIDVISAAYFEGVFFSGLMVTFENILLRLPNNPQAGGARLDRVLSAYWDEGTVGVSAVADGMTAPPTGATYALRLPQQGNGAANGTRRSQVYGFANGIAHNDHTVLDDTAITACLVALAPAGGGHPCFYKHVKIQSCVTDIQPSATGCLIYGEIDVEDETSVAGWNNQYTVNDPNGFLTGEIAFGEQQGTGALSILGAPSLRIKNLRNTSYVDSLTPSAITDSFTRANNALTLSQLDSGQAWQGQGVASSWQISSNAAINTGLAQQTAFCQVFPPSFVPTNYVVQATVSIGATNSQAGLLVKANKGTSFNMLAFIQGSAIAGGAKLTLQTQNGGVYVVLASSSGFTPAISTPYTIKAVVTKGQVLVYVNGTLEITYNLTGTDLTHFAALTGVGITGYSPAASTKWTAFSAYSPNQNVNQGESVLAAGTVAVVDAAITASSVVRVTNVGAGGTVGALSVALTAGTGFTINSTSGADTSTIFWEIVSY